MKLLIVFWVLLIVFSSGIAFAKERGEESERREATTTRSVRSDLKGDNGLHLGIVMRVKNEVSRYITLLEAHINRLQSLITRLTTRANELDARGISTTDGRAHLASSTAELRLAQADLDALKTNAATNAALNASTTPHILKERYKIARELMKSAREHIRKAYDEIRAALKAFREAARANGETD